MSQADDSIERIIAGLILKEAERAVELHGDFNSDHEAYGVLMEEVEEVWEQVKRKCGERDRRAMVEELVQIGAVALKWATKIQRGLLGAPGRAS
jgi:hypothetical protein